LRHDLAQTTHLELGGGYEWLNWDDSNDDDSSFTFSAEAVQQVGDRLSLTGPSSPTVTTENHR
jgi:hypothetical protein